MTEDYGNEQNFIHPNASEQEIDSEHYVTVNNFQIYYEFLNAEKKDQNHAILFVHGWTANRLRLHPLYIQLAQNNFPVFRLDLRGHGWSQKEGSVDFSFPTMVSDIDQFIQKIIVGEHGFSKVSIIAHSMGGSLTQLLAVSQPEYLEKVILIATSCNWTDKPLENFLFRFYINYYKRNFWKKYMKKKPGHAPLGLEHFPMWGTKYNTKGRTLFTNFHATIQGLENMGNFDIRRELSKIKNPCLVLVGSKDVDAPPKYSQKIHELLPNSQLEIVSGGNHDVVIGKAKTVYEIVHAFLEKT